MDKLEEMIKKLKRVGLHLKPEYVSSFKEYKFRYDFTYQGPIYIWRRDKYEMVCPDCGHELLRSGAKGFFICRPCEEKSSKQYLPSNEVQKEAAERFPLGFGKRG